VLDVRFIENPFYDPALRPLSGLTEPVRSFVLLGSPAPSCFMEIAAELFTFAIPAYLADGRSRADGGHRLHGWLITASITIARRAGGRLAPAGPGPRGRLAPRDLEQA
jgi:UPF0042 nucleotide-binding protein